MSKVPITLRGAELLRAELQRLKSFERPAVIAAIAEVEGKLGNAQIIDPQSLDADGRVVFGATVELEDTDEGQTVTYQIVGDDEADIKQRKISFSSPVARSLIGKFEGDVVEVQTPGGRREYEILDVRYE